MVLSVPLRKGVGLAGLWLGLALAGVAAVEAASPAVLVRVAGAGQGALVVFGGETRELRLEAASSLDARVAVRGVLYQVAESVAAPVAKNLDGGEVSVAAGGGREFSFSLPVPAVRTPTAMVLKLQTRGPGAPDDWAAAGEVFLRVLPPTAQMAAALRGQFAWLKKRGVRPVVFGESPALRALLREEGIEFEAVPGLADVTPDGHSVYLGEGGPGELPPALRQGVAIVRWTTDPFAPEGIDLERGPRSFVVTINRAAPVRTDEAALWADMSACLSKLQLQLQPQP